MPYKIACLRGAACRLRRAAALTLYLILAAISPVAALAAQPPATTAAQDGFLPVDESKVQERLPAAPIVMAAYAVAWLVIFGYVWSLWSRLAKVEREIADASRRFEAGPRR